MLKLRHAHGSPPQLRHGYSSSLLANARDTTLRYMLQAVKWSRDDFSKLSGDCFFQR